MSTTRLWYPKLTPRSVTMTRVLPAVTTLSIAWRMSAGARNWPFLMLTTRPGPRRRHDQVGLAREEGGNLEDVGHLGGARRVRRLVDVGEDRHAGRGPHVREDPHALPAGPGPRNDPPDVRFALSYDTL